MRFATAARIVSVGAAWLALVIIPAAFAATISVPADYGTIQLAIDAAAPGDEIHVARGVYNEGIDFRGKSIVVRSVDGPATTTLDATGFGSGAVFRSGEDRTARLEGFTIVGGVGTDVVGRRFGGGIYIAESGPTIVGNVIRSNRADFGGGIACWPDATPLLLSNVIEKNQAGNRGGGIYVEGRSAVEAVGNIIRDNQSVVTGGGVSVFLDAFIHARDNHIDANRSSNGGGVTVEVAHALLETNTILSNTTTRVPSSGGGVRVTDALSFHAIGNRIEDNEASLGGGVSIGGPEEGDVALYVFEGNEVVANRADDGGGLRMIECEVLVRSNVFAANTATNGGGVSIRSRALGRFEGNLVIENRSTEGSTVQGGAGLYLQSAMRIVNNTIAYNVAELTGGGIHLRRVATLENNVLWGNEPVQVGTTSSQPTLVHCLVEGGWTGPGTSNVDADPVFVDPDVWDYRTVFGSPAIDAGLGVVVEAAEDGEGSPRIVDGDVDGFAIVDIGAYESQPAVAACFGSVDRANGPATPVLFVNGRIGDRERVVTVAPGDSVEVTMERPPAQGAEAAFVLYAWIDVPDATTVRLLPYGLGLSAFPVPFLPADGSNTPVVIWNNIGRPALLGMADLPSEPAPSSVAMFAAPLSGASFTLQGIIEDAGSVAEAPFSVTNAVILRVE